MRILIITESVPHFRADWFNELNKYCDTKVLYCKDQERTRVKGWFSDKLIEGKYIKISGMIAALSFINDKSYDIRIVDGYGSSLLIAVIMYQLLARKKFFINIDGIVQKKGSGLRNIIKRFIFRRAPYFLIGSKHTMDYIAKIRRNRDGMYWHPFSSLYAHDILLEPVSLAKKNALRKKYNISGEKVVVAVGRFIPIKNFDLLIRAWEGIGDEKYELLIIGGGEEQKNYETIINALGLRNIKLIDFQPKNILFEYYMASDIFVLPTSTDVWGLVVNEAMACGLPVITTDKCVAGLDLVRDNENGYLVPSGDASILHQRIDNLIKNDGLLKKMGINNLKQIKEYTIENIAGKHVEIFRGKC